MYATISHNDHRLRLRFTFDSLIANEDRRLGGASAFLFSFLNKEAKVTYFAPFFWVRAAFVAPSPTQPH